MLTVPDMTNIISVLLLTSLHRLPIPPCLHIQILLITQDSTQRLPCCCCSVARSCPTLCDPVDCSTPGFPVFHYLPDFAQTQVHWVDDATNPLKIFFLPPQNFFSISLLYNSNSTFFFIFHGLIVYILNLSLQTWSPWRAGTKSVFLAVTVSLWMADNSYWLKKSFHGQGSGSTACLEALSADNASDTRNIALVAFTTFLKIHYLHQILLKQY